MKSLSYTTLARNASRGLLLGSLVYAIWRYGGTDPVVMVHLAIALAIASGLVLTAAKRAFEPSSLPKPYFALISVWVLYAFTQASLSPDLLPWMHGGVLETQRTMAAEPVAILKTAVKEQGAKVAEISATASVVPAETLQAAVPFLLAFAFAVLAAILFDTRRSRRFFLWGVIVNTSFLACWGLIQRAGGGNQILPGIENTFANSMPFASFIYKNAGAAALLPAMPAVVVIWWSLNRRDRSSGYASESRFAFLLDVRKLSLTCLSVLLIAGLLASLSRGAWIAAGVTAVTLGVAAAWRYRRVRGSRALGERQVWIAGAAVVAMVLVTAATGIGMSVRERAEQISIENVSLDQRWAHWRDGITTAWAHFPTGSGLGTYGYATLAHQDETHRSWFREAHNQYLEVFTESGLIGLAIVLSAMAWLMSVSVQLIRREVGREKQGWGWIGLALLIAGGLQSMIDFVLVIPANLFLYASLIGIVGATERRTRPPISRDSADQRNGWKAFDAIVSLQRRPVFHLVVTLLFLLTAFHLSQKEVASKDAISATSLASAAERPSDREVEQSVAQLNDAIAAQPRRSTLYLRRAHWRLVEYRLAVLESAQQEGTALGWQDTAIENIFVAISRMPPQARGKLRQGLRETPEMNRRLEEALGDLAMSLQCNPLEPDAHLLGAMLSPLAEMPVESWLNNSARLSNNSSQKLYCNGVLAFHVGETDLALDQWSRSIEIGHEYLQPIIELARQRIDAAQIVSRLVPDSRPDLSLTLIAVASSDGVVEIDRPMAADVLEQLRDGDRFEPALKHATIARIQSLVGAHDVAVGHWETALRLDTRDPGYRLEYSRSLHELGRHQEALRQAVLGQTLYPVDRRFKHLAARIRRASRGTRQE